MKTTVVCQTSFLLFLFGLSLGKKQAELKIKTEVSNLVRASASLVSTGRLDASSCCLH